MKRCPYCGKEYPDDAMKCFIDGYLLPQTVQAAASEPEGVSIPGQRLDTSDAAQALKIESKDRSVPTYPDYQWSASDGWKCLGIFLIIGFVLSIVTVVMDRRFAFFHGWRRSGLGYMALDLLHYTLYLLTAAYFARTETLPSFLRAFGLDRRPTERVWFGIVMALMIRGFGHFAIVHRWGPGVSNYDLAAFKHTLGVERYLFLVPVTLLAPLFEETTYRGFLYKAFRNSYPLWASMVLIVAWTAYSHWRMYSTSWVAALDLSVLTVVQCYLREKSDGIWDCILCHLAFNASLLFLGHAFR